MKVLFILAASLLSLAASAQQMPPQGGPGMPGMQGAPMGNPPAGASTEQRTSISTAEIAARIGQADAAAKAGTQYRGEPLLQAGPFRAGMEYHAEPATSFSVHENEAELFVVLEGSGTLTMGGTLVNPTRRGTNLMAPTVDGATGHKLAKGDMILVPEGTPHAVTQVDGKIVLMSMHLPRPAPAAAVPAAPAAPAPKP